MVLGHLPNMYKAKGRLLFHHLRNAGVKWSNKGELISRSGDVITGSNAVDREALVGFHRMKQNYGEPSGWGEFLQTLRKANVSRSLLEEEDPQATAGVPSNEIPSRNLWSAQMKNQRDHHIMAQYPTG